jgi:hypothetical protein
MFREEGFTLVNLLNSDSLLIGNLSDIEMNSILQNGKTCKDLIKAVRFAPTIHGNQGGSHNKNNGVTLCAAEQYRM